MSDPAEAAAWGLPWAHALAGLVVATASGLVIGLERERSAQAREHRRFVGVRTLALIGLGGGMSGLLGSVWGLAIPIVFLLSVAGLSLGASLADTDDPPGVTTEVSAFAVALMGLTATSPLPGISPSSAPVWWARWPSSRWPCCRCGGPSTAWPPRCPKMSWCR